MDAGRRAGGRALPLAALGSLALHGGLIAALLIFVARPDAAPSGGEPRRVILADLLAASPAEAPPEAGAQPAAPPTVDPAGEPAPAAAPRAAPARAAAPDTPIGATRIGEPWERAVTSPGAPSSSAAPILEHRVQPRYPRRARQAQREGVVVLGAALAEDGTVRDLTILSAEPEGWFEDAAIEAVSQWRYAPETARTGADALVVVEIRFELE